MRTPALLCCAALMVACAPAEEQPPAETAATPAVTLADFSGNWTMNTMTGSSDSVILTYDMTASGDPAGWTITFPGRDPLPLAVRLDGDSVMGMMGPYESALRSGVMVTTEFVTRMENGMVHGTFVARYETTGADSVLRGRVQGTRKMP